MTRSEILRRRLFNQQIADTKFKKPHEIVNWLGAMQAQEFAMAKWAIALRLPNVEVKLFRSLNKTRLRAVAHALQRYRSFVK